MYTTYSLRYPQPHNKMDPAVFCLDRRRDNLHAPEVQDWSSSVESAVMEMFPTIASRHHLPVPSLVCCSGLRPFRECRRTRALGS